MTKIVFYTTISVGTINKDFYVLVFYTTISVGTINKDFYVPFSISFE